MYAYSDRLSKFVVCLDQGLTADSPLRHLWARLDFCK